MRRLSIRRDISTISFFHRLLIPYRCRWSPSLLLAIVFLFRIAIADCLHLFITSFYHTSFRHRSPFYIAIASAFHHSTLTSSLKSFARSGSLLSSLPHSTSPSPTAFTSSPHYLHPIFLAIGIVPSFRFPCSHRHRRLPPPLQFKHYNLYYFSSRSRSPFRIAVAPLHHTLTPARINFISYNSRRLRVRECTYLVGTNHRTSSHLIVPNTSSAPYHIPHISPAPSTLPHLHRRMPRQHASHQ